jgi:hypothetical protein
MCRFICVMPHTILQFGIYMEFGSIKKISINILKIWMNLKKKQGSNLYNKI